jgi:hypothetical protein
MPSEEMGTRAFLTFDAGLDIGQARSLVDKISPDYVVIRFDDELPSGSATSPSYAVLNASDFLAPDIASRWTTIGDIVGTQFVPAIVLDTDDGWRVDDGASLALGTSRSAVLVGDDGIVTEILPVLNVVPGGRPAAESTYDAVSSWRGRHLHQVVGDRLIAMLRSTGPRMTGSPPDGLAVDGDASQPSTAHDAGVHEVGFDGAGVDGIGEEDGGNSPMALEVQFPDAVRLTDTVPVLVVLQDGPGGPGSAPLSARPGEVLEIMVSPTSGFTLVDAAAKSMTVVADGGTLPVKFDLRADKEGKGVARIYAFRDGACVAALTVSAEITVSEVSRTPIVPAEMPIAAPIKAAADLELWVMKESHLGGVALKYRLTDASRRTTSEFGPHALNTDPSAYVHASFDEIQRLARRPGDWGNAERIRLERIGTELYEALVPPDLQAVLWNTDRVRSFLVQTEEPWIPWELCRMTVTEHGQTRARGFLCELYEMSRWMPGVEPKTNLHATRVGVIAPRDSQLPSAPGEVAMLELLSAVGPSVERLKATYESVVAALESHRYDVLHFVGHGANRTPDDASRSEFRLAGRWVLKPSDISGETRNLGLASPIVFMNACEVAQASMGLHGIGGWAAAMTNAGAGAFIGTHWDVRDDLALEFATTFYAKLADGNTVQGAALQARQAVKRRPGADSSWLAYSVHASPGATCTFAPMAR